LQNAFLPPTRVNRPPCKLISTDLGSDPPSVACRVFHPAAKGSDYCYLHDPVVAERRKRNASRAATLGNSKIGAEIRSTRLKVRDLVETTVSGELNPAIRKRLAEVVQLVQSYCRLAELEISAGEGPGRETLRCPKTRDSGSRSGRRGGREGRVHGEAPDRRQGPEGGAVTFSRHSFIGFAD